MFFFLLSVVSFWIDLCNGQTTWCYEAYECANDVIDLTTNFECGGYRGCQKSSIEVDLSLYCDGSLSCYDSSVLVSGSTDNVGCRGYFSCAMSDYVSGGDDTWCRSEYSCANVLHLTNGYISGSGNGEIICMGDKSCAFSNITLNPDAKDIDVLAWGPFSLYNTSIYNNGKDISIEFFGYYSGYQSNIFCDKNTICTLDCYGSGCYNTNFYCNKSESTCIVNCDNDTTICPNGWGSPVIIDNEYGYNGIFHNFTLYLDSMLAEYNDYYSIIPDTLIPAGQSFNTFANKILSTRNSSCIVNCDDRDPYNDDSLCKAEADIVIDNSSNVCCTAYSSCDLNTIIVENDNEEIDINGNLFCDGRYSCEYIDLVKNVNIIHSTGTESQHLTIYNSNAVICSSYQACRNFNYHNVKIVVCSSLWSCEFNEFYNVEHLFCSSYLSCKESTIYSNGTNINIYVLSKDTLDNTVLYCDDNDICNIYCSADLCDDINESNLNCNNDNCNIISVSNHQVKEFTDAPSMIPSMIPSTMPSAQPTIAMISESSTSTPVGSTSTAMSTSDTTIDTAGNSTIDTTSDSAIDSSGNSTMTNVSEDSSTTDSETLVEPEDSSLVFDCNFCIVFGLITLQLLSVMNI